VEVKAPSHARTGALKAPSHQHRVAGDVGVQAFEREVVIGVGGRQPRDKVADRTAPMDGVA
jgi:hypothetical protein